MSRYGQDWTLTMGYSPYKYCLSPHLAWPPAQSMEVARLPTASAPGPVLGLTPAHGRVQVEASSFSPVAPVLKQALFFHVYMTTHFY